MNFKEYVEGLFADYPDNSTMNDFKEEICSNLADRVAYMEKKGMSAEEAFAKATAELGDISEIAEQISHEKRKAVFESMYMKTRNYMDTWHKIGYALAGGFLALGVILALTVYLNTNEPSNSIFSLIPFFIAPVCAFVFLGLTQETARNYPMSWKRALFYVLAVGPILFGLIVFSAMIFESDAGLPVAVATLIPFVLPGGTLLAFLILTQKSRHKPWVRKMEAAWAEEMHRQAIDPHAVERFGLFSGALWIVTLALFIALGFIIGFQYSWLVFLFAVAAQILMVAFMLLKK